MRPREAAAAVRLAMNLGGVSAVTAFVVLWCMSLGVAAAVGGWRGLARTYRATRAFVGVRWHLQHARLRYGVGYNGCLTVGADRFGLYLAVLAPFRAFHPPLFLPWSDLQAEPRKTWFVSVVRITARKVPGVSIVVSERLAARLRGAATGAMVDPSTLVAVGL